MKRVISLLFMLGALMPDTAKAQIENVTLPDGTVIKVDRKAYPDLNLQPFSGEAPADYKARRKARAQGKAPAIELPPYVYNGEDKYFPPIFNQDGGSCGSAQNIGYMFTHEINSLRDLDASLPENQYPTHFTWLLTYQNSDKEDMARANGIPNVPTYGGRTYSRLFGAQTHDDNFYGWMTGYDKWYSAMWNRAAGTLGFAPTNTPEGRRELKEWLYNHSGDETMHSGGIAGIGVAAYGTWASIPASAANRSAGVVGMKYVAAWGDVYNHAVTICGYDDRIEFDLDGDGKVGEVDEDEVGAWIIANSWGNGWENKGFIYCPYKYSYAVGKDQGAWSPGSYYIRRDYRPLRTIKLLMDYSRRSEILLCAGASQNLNATKPERTVNFEHFKYAGDSKNASPAPEVPMLGQWADGMHYEPMEFGYDLTDLTLGLDRTKPIRYFFIVRSKSDAIGEGHILKASIINYESENEGVEIPFEQQDVTIQNRGRETVISVVVPGEQLYPATNLELTDGVLSWTKPQASSLRLVGYRVYCGTQLLSTVPASQTYYRPDEQGEEPYIVKALYATGSYETESAPTNAVTDIVPLQGENQVASLQQSGFTIPGVMSEELSQATIEFWIKCDQIANYVQQVGPGWGKFLFHTDSSGRLVVGWNTSSGDRMQLASAFTKGRWYHVAIVVSGNQMTAYVNGMKKGSITSSNYTGLSAFGDMKFGHSGSDSWFNGCVDEVRIWRTARSQPEIRNNMRLPIANPAQIADLIAYLPMDVIEVDGQTRLREWIHGRHATFHTIGTCQTLADESPFTGSKPSPYLNMTKPAQAPVCGLPFTLSASSSVSTTSYEWSIPDASAYPFRGQQPTVVLPRPGRFPVTLTATFASGETLSVTDSIDVVDGTMPVAAFDVPVSEVPAGDRFCFINRSEGEGCTYLWSMPGAEVEEYGGTNATALYPQTGTFKVTLTATNSYGSSSVTHEVRVSESAPAPFFDISESAILLGDTLQLIDQSRYSPEAWLWEVACGSRGFVSKEQSPWIVPSAPGVYDVTLSVSNQLGENSLTRRKMLYVSNADPGSCLNFTGVERLEMDSPITEEMKYLTMEWWMRPKAMQGCGVISSEDGQLSSSVDSKGVLSITLGGKTSQSAEGYVLLNEWHHYAVTYSYGSVRFYRDGQLFNLASAKLPTRFPALPGKLTIGSASGSFNGQMDELRIWNSTLTQALLSSRCNVPLQDVASAVENDGLMLYYDFNQNSGDVIDRTGFGRNARRIGFGPDGDAWNSALGVFALDASQDTSSDLSARFLTNYKNPFLTSSGTVNTSNSSRFLRLAMGTTKSKWKDQNAIVSGGITTGAHIDTSHNKDITFETVWSGFAENLVDYRLWQPVTLPAGRYTFSCTFGDGSDCQSSRIVACAGAAMVSDAVCEEEALAYAPLSEGTISFNLSEETQVSLGIIVNLIGKASFNINAFSLTGVTHEPLTTVEHSTDGIIALPQAQPTEASTLYDLQGRRIQRPAMHGVYIQQGRKLLK